MVKAYRIYYTLFDEDLNKKVVSKVKKYFEEKIGEPVELIEHKSFIKEFRYIEVKSEKLTSDLEEEVKDLIKKMLEGESSYVRVDYINL